MDEDDEEALIRRALEMSMMDVNTSASASDLAPSSSSVMEVAAEEEDDVSSSYFPLHDAFLNILQPQEEAELRMALQLSVGATSSSSSVAPDVVASSDFLDVDFVNQLLGSGDHDDPLIQAALAQMGGRNPTDAPESEEEKSKKRKGDDV